jgi:hypothetical protein
MLVQLQIFDNLTVVFAKPNEDSKEVLLNEVTYRDKVLL